MCLAVVTEPTRTQVEAARRLSVDLHFGSVPLAVARLAELIEALTRRVEELEGRKKSSWSLR